MAATLYAVPASHPCAAIEKALQLKGIEYRRVDIPPVAHKAVLYALFGRATVPGLVLDGEKVIGSREIVRTLDERVPEPPLLPADEKERKSVESRRGVGRRGPAAARAARRSGWRCGASPAALPSYGEGSRLPIPDVVSRLTAPLVTRAEQRINDGTELNVRADLARARPPPRARGALDGPRRRRRRAAQRRGPPDRLGARAAADDRGHRQRVRLAPRAASSRGGGSPTTPGTCRRARCPPEWLTSARPR